MGKPYSLDLRVRVLKAIENGERVGKVAKKFSIDTKTVYLWGKQKSSRGTIDPITKYQKGHSHKIKDLDKFKRFAEENNSLTSKEMAIKWGNISQRTICRMLKKIDFTRKKRPLVTSIGMSSLKSYLRSPKKTGYT